MLRVWLLDVANKLPSAQCHGFDIDTSHAPGPKWLPPNMSVERFDAFADEIPSELIEVYDVVHVGIFVLVVRNNDPGKMVRNLFRMLSTSSPLPCAATELPKMITVGIKLY